MKESSDKYIIDLIKSIKDLNISKSGEISYIKNIGIKNIALNCYINSFLQILFHTEPLLKELKLKKLDTNIEKESMTYKLNKVFDNIN